MPSLKNWIYKGLIAYGMIRVGWFVLRKAYNLIHRFKMQVKTLRSIYASDDKPPYAVITGGTHGIGLEFANQLARAGFNLVLMARDAEKMKQCALRLKEFKVDVKCVTADFSKGDKEDFWKGIQEHLKGLDIAFLINNVGKYDWTALTEQTEENIQQLLSMNVFTPTVLTRLVLPNMLQRESRSAVINISSFVCEAEIPKTAVNAGSKKYVVHFTKCLANEYFDRRIDFLAVVPGFTDTGGLAAFTFGTPMLVTKPEQLVEGALKDVKIANIVGNVSYGSTRNSFFIWLLKNSITKGYILNKIAGENFH